MSIESRLKRLEAARVNPPERPEIIITFVDDDGPQLKAGWNPELGIFQIVWPDHEKDSNPSPPAT